ncbi:MAG TPA: hypothetical protein PKW90_10895, partial [Myxococcota bacterium]|nr:hypothetical protein [Myxococcota bacterium]
GFNRVGFLGVRKGIGTGEQEREEERVHGQPPRASYITFRRNPRGVHNFLRVLLWFRRFLLT